MWLSCPTRVQGAVHMPACAAFWVTHCTQLLSGTLLSLPSPLLHLLFHHCLPVPGDDLQLVVKRPYITLNSLISQGSPGPQQAQQNTGVDVLRARDL